ncbi:hypothetical protein [Duganella callida]|uniref:hypothetical protein n=1 Tax=Duganella callida TaxID=2561932 RepID=UPI0014301609|nr:hypothetical protein [Duganella callida]
MSIMISAIQDFSLFQAVELALLIAAAGGLLTLFKPLLRGCARAAVLAVKQRALATRT